MPRSNPTVRLVRDLLQGLEAQAEDEARELDHEQREAAGRKRDEEYHNAVLGISYSLRRISEVLQDMRQDRLARPSVK